MKGLYVAILAKLDELKEAATPIISSRNIWNNQLDRARAAESEFYPFTFPAVFVEVLDPVSIKQLGRDDSGKNGILYDAITVRLHIIHEKYDSQDGDFDKNLEVFDLKRKISDTFNKWKCDGSSTFMLMSETQDFDHDNLYHYIQDYVTSFVEFPTVTETDAVPFVVGVEYDLNAEY